MTPSLALTIAAAAAGVIAAVVVPTLIWRRLQSRQFKPVGADEAVRVVWMDTFRQPMSQCPRVFWVRATMGQFGFMASGRKVAGLAHLDANAINVGFPADENAKFSASALSYELARCCFQIHGRPQYDTPQASVSDKADFEHLSLRGTAELKRRGM